MCPVEKSASRHRWHRLNANKNIKSKYSKMYACRKRVFYKNGNTTSVWSTRLRQIEEHVVNYSFLICPKTNTQRVTTTQCCFRLFLTATNTNCNKTIKTKLLTIIYLFDIRILNGQNRNWSKWIWKRQARNQDLFFWWGRGVQT